MTESDSSTIWRIVGIDSPCEHARTQDWTLWVDAPEPTGFLRILDMSAVDDSTLLALPKLISAFALAAGQHSHLADVDLLDAASGLFGRTVRGIDEGEQVRLIALS